MITWDKWEQIKKQLPEGATMGDAVRLGFITEKEARQLVEWPIYSPERSESGVGLAWLAAAFLMGSS